MRRRLLLGMVALALPVLAQESSLASVRYPRQGGELTGYLARPDLSDGTGVILVQDQWGVTPMLQGAALRLAGLGYTVLIPDLYSRLGGTGAMPLRNPDEIRYTIRQLSDGQVITDLDGSFVYLEQQIKGDQIRPRIGVVGFGWGSTKALVYGCENFDLKAMALFGGMAPEPIERLGQLQLPVLGQFPQEAAETKDIPRLESGIKNCRIQVLAGTRTNFWDPSHPNYDPPATQQSWAQITEFLATQLRGGTVAS